VGQSEDQVIYLDLVTALRRQYLPMCDDVVSISRFIRDSQAIVDAPAARHSVIYLGGDHVDQAGRVGSSSGDDEKSGRLFGHIRSTFRCVVLQVGRFEPYTYKCSEQVFQIAEFMKAFHRDVAFCYLGDLNNHSTPHELRPGVFALGRPSDKVLFDIIERCDLTYNPSLWEGFNLPLLEAQWLGKPCLVMNIGAHPEVVWNRGMLCADMIDLRLKMLDLLAVSNFCLDPIEGGVEFQKARFRWQDMGNAYLTLIDESLIRPTSPEIRDSTHSVV
jgi:glycosyltransferase involved in cell wall biosynthesis